MLLWPDSSRKNLNVATLTVTSASPSVKIWPPGLRCLVRPTPTKSIGQLSTASSASGDTEEFAAPAPWRRLAGRYSGRQDPADSGHDSDRCYPSPPFRHRCSCNLNYPLNSVRGRARVSRGFAARFCSQLRQHTACAQGTTHQEDRQPRRRETCCSLSRSRASHRLLSHLKAQHGGSRLTVHQRRRYRPNGAWSKSVHLGHNGLVTVG